MPIYDVEVVTWVTVHADSEKLAREIVSDRLANGDYNESFEGFGEIGKVELAFDQSQI